MAGVLLATGGMALTGCAHDPEPFDPRAAQDWERSADDQVKRPPQQPLPTTMETPYVPGETTTRPLAINETLHRPVGPTVRMTLQEVVHRAVANNLDIRVAGFDTAVDQTRILEAQANFDPTFFSDLSFERVDKQTGGTDSAIPGAAAIRNPGTNNAQDFVGVVTHLDFEAITTFDVGFRQNLGAGGKIQISQTVTNSYFNPARSILNPYYENDLVLTLTQPLLQNFGVAVNAARITIAQNTQRISLLDFRKTVEDTVLKIEQTYWQLVQAERDVDTFKKLVAESERTTKVLFDRQGQDVTAIQLQNANAQTESRKVTLIQLQAQVENLSNQLKQLMSDPSFPVSGDTVIAPSDDFLDKPLQFNEDDLIETALENRLELGQQQERIKSSETAVDVARNGLLPQLTLQLQGTVDGLARDFNSTFSNEGNFNHLGFQAGLQFQLPIGNRAARAVWQRSLLQRMQAITAYGAAIQNVTLDVKLAATQVYTSQKRLHAARNARLIWDDLLVHLRTLENAGDQPLSYESVTARLQTQEQAAGAEQAEHQAESDYSYALANLEKAKGTILRYNNVMMEQENLPFDSALRERPVVRPLPAADQAARAAMQAQAMGR